MIEARTGAGAIRRRIRIHGVSIHSNIYMQIQVWSTPYFISYSVQHTDRDARERAIGVISRLIFWPIIQFMYADAPNS